MSSILKALQRLERETSAGRKPNDPSRRQLRQLVPRKMAGRSRGIFLRRAAFTAFIVLLLGAFSWAIWRYSPPLPGRVGSPPAGTGADIAKTDSPPSTEGDRSQAPAKAEPLRRAAGQDLAAATAPAVNATATRPVAAPAAALKGTGAATAPGTEAAPAVNATATRPITAPAAALKGTGAATAPGTEAAPAVNATATRPITAPAAALKGTGAATAPGTEAAPAVNATATRPITAPAAALKGTGAAKTPGAKAATANPPGAADRRSHDDLPVRSQEETGMAIQALVWSSAPEDRLVVINGSILKEGDSIDGASVSHIGEDYIVVRRGGDRWKLKFQLQ